MPPSQPILLLKLTPNGRRRFFALISASVRAGRQHHRPFHISISVNGRVVEEQTIGYRGHLIPLRPAGIVVDVASTREAGALAARLNR